MTKTADYNDTLLHWLSQRGSVPLQSFKKGADGVIAEAHKDPENRKRRVRDVLASLLAHGHVEIVRQRVEVLSPTVILHHHSRGVSGVLTGARVLWWEPELSEAAELSFEVLDQPGAMGPRLWKISCQNRELVERYAESFGWRVCSARPLDLLRALPSFRQALSSLASDAALNRGSECFLFQGSRAKWRVGTQRTGLFRDGKIPYGNWHWIGEKKTVIIPPASELRAVSKWFELSRQTELDVRYDENLRELKLPALGARLPLILKRALVMGSGLFPEYVDGFWVYKDISPGCARQTARIMSCPLKEAAR